METTKLEVTFFLYAKSIRTLARKVNCASKQKMTIKFVEIDIKECFDNFTGGVVYFFASEYKNANRVNGFLKWRKNK